MARILIVDDEASICEEFRELVQEEGAHTVDIALTGDEAIQKAAEEDYDLIFLDILLPRMEGRQIFEEIRKIKPARVVFISGYMPSHTEEEALKLGAVACLRKPLDFQHVNKLIQESL